MKDRIPGAPGQFKAKITGNSQNLLNGDEFTITLQRDDRPVEPGTPYSKAAVLPDEVAKAICPDVNDPTPKDAFAALHAHTKSLSFYSASGTVIRAENSGDAPLHALKIYGKTIQNGTPAPDAPVALESVGDGGSVIVSVAGKNLFDFTKVSLQNGAFDENGRFTNTIGNQGVTKQSNYGFQEWINRTTLINHNVIMWESGRKHYIKTITLHPDTTTLCFRLFGQKEAAMWIEYLKLPKGATITLSFDMVDDTPQAQLIENIQIEVGGEETAYAPAKTIQNLVMTTTDGLPGIPIPSGGNYTDKNGQQYLVNYRDWERGVDEINAVAVTYDGSDDEAWYKHSATNDTYNFCMSIPEIYSPPTDGGAGTYSYGLCNRFTWTANRNLLNASNPGISCDYGGRHRLFVGVGTLISEYTLEAFKTWLSAHPLQVVYQTQTPIETPIPEAEMAAYRALHTNKPNTTVYNDANGYMELEYYSPNSALPVDMGSGRAGHLLTVDEYGFVTTLPNPVIESVEHRGCYYRTVNGTVEWINPPMVIGAEYRTTERYEGNAVYVTTLSLGTLPNTTTKAFAAIAGVDRLVDTKLIAKQPDGVHAVVNHPNMEALMGYNAGGSTWFDIIAHADFSSYAGWLQVKYTKV